MVKTSDLRESSRRPIHGRAEVRLGNGVVVEGEAKDISLQGLMFHSERRLPVGKSVRIVLIPECDPPNFRINAGGFVARLHDEGVAVRFTDIGPESLQYLSEAVLHACSGETRPRA